VSVIEMGFNWHTLSRVTLPWIPEIQVIFTEARHVNINGDVVRTVRNVFLTGC